MKWERLSFDECVNEPLLLKKPFDALSLPQQAILKIIYGLPLNTDELAIWNAFNGFGVTDELGYLIDVNGSLPYVPQEYSDITLICGRRGGKTSGASSFVVAYEALFGGHKANVAKRQSPTFVQLSQDKSTSRENLRQHILHIIEESPIGAKELLEAKRSSGKDSVTADVIRLRTGQIVVGAATIKVRGAAIACCAMDELAVWPKDRDSSNPDYEVESAVLPALAQFYPFDKLIKTSTPWTEEGLLWTAHQAGTQGRFLPEHEQAQKKRSLVLRATTAQMKNPAIKYLRQFLMEKHSSDPLSFRREYLAEFAKSVSGFLNIDLLRATITKGLTVRPPAPNHLYIGVLDPAFKRDAFAFCIGHVENDIFHLDFSQAWRGTPTQPLSPMTTMAAIANICKSYKVRLVYSDQYHLESLTEIAEQVGLNIIPSPLTNGLKKQMWGDFEAYLLQGKLSLLDDETVINELAKMEKRLTPNGEVQFGGKHDDTATVIALCLKKCKELGEVAQKAAPQAEKPLATRLIEQFHKPRHVNNEWDFQ